MTAGSNTFNQNALDLRQNHVLAALLQEDLERLRPHFRAVRLVRGRILVDAAEPFAQVYFPTSAVVSQVILFEDGRVAEAATVGNEGAVGIAALLEGKTALVRHMVEVTGSALVIDFEPFQRAVEESRSLRSTLLCYVQAFLAQVLQSVGCNVAHSAEERCARWLLMTHDRAGTSTFDLTQEFLAEMLGVHRPTVNVIARSFQAAGLIHYRRGAITVVDRKRLEEASCECYALIQRQYRRLFPCRKD